MIFEKCTMFCTPTAVISGIFLFFVRKTSKPANCTSQNTENQWETEAINIIISTLFTAKTFKSSMAFL